TSIHTYHDSGYVDMEKITGHIHKVTSYENMIAVKLDNKYSTIHVKDKELISKKNRKAHPLLVIYRQVSVIVTEKRSHHHYTRYIPNYFHNYISYTLLLNKTANYSILMVIIPYTPGYSSGSN